MNELAAQFIFISFFTAIISLFYIILRSISWSRFSANDASRRDALLFSFLTLGSFVHTWFYMFKFLAWSFHDYESHKNVAEITGKTLLERMTAWLVDSTLFEQAWVTVCAGPLNWWWSEQICAYTVGAWTVFLFLEGQRHKIQRIWAYMLLGQLVAISVASNLFYLALSLSPHNPVEKRSQPLRAKPILWISIFTSLFTVAYTPYTSEKTFFPNLLVMHVMLTIPLIYVSLRKYSSNPSERFTTSFKTLYAFIFIFASLIRIRTVIAAFQAVPYYTDVRSVVNLMPLVGALWETLHSHPAQSSIGWDAVWTSGSFVIWAWLKYGNSLSLRNLLVNTIVASAGVMAPFLELVVPSSKNARGSEAGTDAKSS
ncbi:hypothetical protein K435DRAFT_795244 [Dendrothele bispora CBS 962.96]|uniref:Uncharacterized protein n=1 Tax=Dendrothele bispora (strain CBS 962.96) TaxID=1314807 RepID=A0A4S8M989_DENBC|nr:hypothetical protein K435DRAFT_795244 [Dendrothele bispora CBS 962.96]